MPESRPAIRWLELVAHGLGPPCLAAAGCLFLLVSWVPAALRERDLLCGALLVAGIGASMVTSGGSSPRLRRTGAVVMGIGFAAVAAVILW